MANTKLNIIKRPIEYSTAEYHQVYDFVVNHYRNNEKVKCICTFGNINKPGISDIDLLVVFKDQTSCDDKILNIIPDHLHYLFTHGVMALNEKHWSANRKYALWDNQKTIYGTEPETENEIIEESAKQSLKIQTAIEFLVVNYIDLKLQSENKTIKLRDLLQHTKGLVYDLEYLNITNSKIIPYVTKVKKWISNWFLQIPADQEINNWFTEFEREYEIFLQETLTQFPLYLPEAKNYQFSKSIKLVPSKNLAYSRKGINAPSGLSTFLGKTYSKVQNKLNTYTIEVPIVNQPSDKILEERVQFFKEMKSYNNEHFPNFASLTTSLMSKLV